MKRQILLFLLFALVAGVVHAELADAGFVMSDIEQTGLDPIDFQVTSSELSLEDQAISFQFDLNYDAALFSYDGYTAGEDLPGMLVVNDLNPGVLLVAYADATILTGVNELITVHLTPVEACETIVTMTEARYNNTEISNITGGSILIEGIPELEFVIEEVIHQGLSIFTATVYSNEIMAEDGIISYQFDLSYDSGLLEFIDYTYDAGLTGELVVNATEPGIIQAAYSGSEVISGITELINLSFMPLDYGSSVLELSEMAYNNYILEEAVSGAVTVYPAWEEMQIEVTGADVFTGDQFTSEILTSAVMLENDIISFQFVLNYDAELMEYAGVAGYGERLDDIVINATEPGVIQAAYASSEAISGEGLLVGFLFEAISDGATQIYLSEFVYNNTYITNLIPGDVTITNPNIPPVADAGEDIELLEGESGMLDGSGSYDPNDDAITYLWAGDLVLDDPASATPAFIAPEVDEDTDYLMTLTVDDGEFQATDEVIVTVVNVPNPADAVITAETIETAQGEDFSVGISTSPLDPEFGVISYQYIITYDPAIITYTGYAAGEGLPEGVLMVNGTEPGVIQAAFSSADAIANPGVLNYLNFTADELGMTDLLISEFYYNNTAVTNLVNGEVSIQSPFYFVEVYAEDLTAGLEMEFTCNVITEELLAEWNIISYQFHLYYDPAMLEYTGYQLGDLPAGGNLLSYEVEPGHLSVAFADYNPLVGSGSLAGFNFIPQQLGSTEIQIEEFKYNATYLPEAGSGNIDIIIPYSQAVITAPELTVGGGESFTVGISTTEMLAEWGVISFQFDLGFDAELLEYTGYQAGSIIEGGNLLAFENADGNVSIAFADYAAISGEGTLVELEFTAAMALDQSILDISSFKYNSLFLDDANQIDGMVTIIEPYANTVITCPDVSTREGMNFTVGISTTEIQEEWGLISFQFNLGFDPDYVEYVGYQSGEMITSGNLLAFENAAGNVSVAFADYMSLDGVGELVELEFTALLAGDTVLDINEFKYNAYYLSDENLIDGEVFIDLGNYPPVADAGADQIVDEGTLVELDGSGSYDPDDLMRTPDWDLNPPDYEYNGFIWGVVEVNGVQVDDVNDMIGVFVGEECRGIAQQSTNSVVDYTVPFGHVAFMPQVYSNVTSGETFTFKYYDYSSDMIYDVEGSLEWEADMVVGNGWDPYIFAVTADPVSNLIFNWIAPEGIELDDPTSITPSFTAPWLDEDTDFVIGLEVSDGEAWSEIDEVVITVTDHPIDEIVVSAPDFELDESVEFTVPVSTTMIQPDMNIISYQFTLSYDPAVIQYDGYTAGSLSPNMLVVNNVEPGVVNVAYADSNPLSGAGELILFDFTTLEGGVTPLDIEEFKYNNTYVTAIDGEVIVIAVNDPPQFNLPDVISWNEDETLVEDFSEYIIDPDNDYHDIAFGGNTVIQIEVDGYDVTMYAPENWYGSETVTFIVNDNAGRAVATDSAVLNVISVNDIPIADAGEDQVVTENDVVYLDGSGSWDLELMGDYRTPEWNLNPPDYEYNGFIWGVVEVNGVQVDDTNDMIGVFAGEECRGIAQQSTNSVVDYTVPFGHVAFMPQVYSNVTSGETFTFKYYDHSEDTIYDVEGSLEWEADMVVGDGWDPYIFAVTLEEPPSELIYNWLPPAGIVLDDPSSATPMFTAPWVDGDTDFVIGLEVFDGEDWSEIDEVVITVIDNPLEAVEVSVPVLAVDENTMFAVPVSTTNLQPDMEVTSLQFSLVYDPALIEYSSYQSGELLSGTMVVNLQGPGLINIAYAGSEIITGAGELITIDFEATEGGVTPLDIQNFVFNSTAPVMIDGEVEIYNVNDAPQLDLPASFDFDEDTELTIDFSNYINDPDNDMHTITPVGNEDIMIDISGYEVTMYAGENWFGSETVLFIVDDNTQRATDEGEVVINVNPVNDPPVLEVPPVMYFEEDGEMYFDVEQYVYDVEDDELTLTVSGMDHLIAEIDGLMAVITAEENWYGSETLTFMVDDQQGRATAVDYCEFIIEPVNDAPTLELPDYISFNEDESLLFDVALYAADVDMDELSIAGVDYTEPSLYYAIDGMEINFYAEEDWYGITEVSVTVTDNVGRDVASDVMTVEVLPVNDAPEIDIPESLSFDEDEMLEIDFEPYIYDVDMDELVLTASAGVDIFVDIQGYLVSFTATENWYGTEEFTFTIDDMQGRLIAQDNVTVTVNPVNDAPVIDEYLPAENQLVFNDTTEVNFEVFVIDIEDDATISWYINDQLLPGMHNSVLPITFDHNGEFSVKAEVADADYMVENLWTITVWMGPDWQPIIYPSSTTAYTRVTLNGVAVSTLDMVGAFVNDEMRGWAHPIISQTDGMTYATIVVNGVAIEEIEFIMYDYSANQYYEIYDTFTSNPGGEIGTPPNFIVLNYGTGEGPNWTPVIYTNSTIVYGIVEIEGMPASAGDRVGCFVGPECRAVADVIISDRETAYATLIVQGETPEIAYFRVWDESEDIILSVPTTIVTNPGGEIGYPPNEIIINATESSTITQDVNLASGWNLISLNVYPDSYLIPDLFAELIENEELLKIKDIFNSYDPDLPAVYNTLNEFNDGAGYYVRVANTTTLAVQGQPVNVEDSQIALNAGWNLTGYLPQVPQNLEAALISIWDQLLKIKDSFGSYDPALPPEFNTLTTMNPGSGYWIKMFSAATLIYPTGVRYQINVNDYNCPIWEPVIYTNSTIAYGEANLDGLPAEGYIAAFAGDECRAAAPVENGIISLVINGTETESVSFKLYSNGGIYESSQLVSTDPGNDVAGLKIDFQSGEVPLVTHLANVYPNPFNPETNISYELSAAGLVRLEIYNIRGQKTATLINQHQPAGQYNVLWNAADQSSGVYFLRFMANGQSETRKVILMK